MKYASLLAAAAIVLTGNTFALIHAWHNRTGTIETDITLTERELELSSNLSNDDSGVTLSLRWTEPRRTLFRQVPRWLDQNILRQLGFDTSVAPSDGNAAEFYGRQRPRQVFVALEYDGPAWRKLLSELEQEARDHPEVFSSRLPPYLLEPQTHLIAVDASTDASRLRGRHPDRHSTIILPAVVRIAVQPSDPTAPEEVQRPGHVFGTLQEIPTAIHVPKPFSDLFRRMPKDRSKWHYRVHLRFGASFEPWIAGVEFP